MFLVLPVYPMVHINPYIQYILFLMSIAPTHSTVIPMVSYFIRVYMYHIRVLHFCIISMYHIQ